jgi:dihydroneopterin aldolase
VNDPLTIELRGLVVFARHGVHAFEQEQGQRFVLDLRLVPQSARALETDRLDDTVSYGEVARLAAEICEGRRFDLIERLAAVIGDTLLTRFPLERVTVSVHKPSAPIALPFSDVVVTVERTRAPSIR